MELLLLHVGRDINYKIGSVINLLGTIVSEKYYLVREIGPWSRGQISLSANNVGKAKLDIGT